MRRWILVVYIFVICLLGEGFLFTLVEAQDLVSRNYVVQYGDTLWDIAGDRLNARTVTAGGANDANLAALFQYD